MIHASNLCTEIMQYSSPDEIAVCTLASVVLPALVRGDGQFDLANLHQVIKIMVRNTDRVIDLNQYPSPKARLSAQRTRALGIGVQGLADVFKILHMPYDSDQAHALNVSIFETIYHAALDASCDLAQQYGVYAAYEGSPASKGRLQFDLWGSRPTSLHDFDTLKTRIHAYGLRNSLLTAQMPTSSTSQISGFNDGTEPYVR